MWFTISLKIYFSRISLMWESGLYIDLLGYLNFEFPNILSMIDNQVLPHSSRLIPIYYIYIRTIGRGMINLVLVLKILAPMCLRKRYLVTF